MRTRAPIRVRYAETDQMGIVYHANYYVWFEVARGQWMEDRGMSYREMEEADVLVPVVETHCVYRKPAKYDDRLLVEIWLGEVKGIRVHYFYRVIREQDQELLTEGHTVHTFMDRSGKPLNLKRKHPEWWEKFIANIEDGEIHEV